MSPVALGSSRAVSVSRMRGARKAAIPGYLQPCDPTLQEHAPKGNDWHFEIKADGYRAQLHVRPEGIKVYSRGGLDWTAQFSSIAAAAPELEADSAVLDGEAIVYGKTGVSDFQQLRRELRVRKSSRVRY